MSHCNIERSRFLFHLAQCAIAFFCFTACVSVEPMPTTREKIERLDSMKSSTDPYVEYYDQYWDLLHHSYETACSSPLATADFLSLASWRPLPADAGEFISEGVETLCLQETVCFKEAVKTLALDERNAIEEILKNPLFYDAEALRICQW